MFKNTASQKWIVFAFEDEGGTNPGEPVTGDAANITANLRLDGGAANAVDDVNPTELEDGFYVFDLTQAETNANMILIAPASSTANVNVIGVPGVVYTTTDVSGIEAKIDTVDSNVDAVLVDTGTTLPATLGTPAGADLAADIAAVKVDTAAVLVDTGTTLPATLGSPAGASLAADIATVDTVVDAVKVKTDQMVFTKANELDVNTQSINGAGVVGDGNATPWDGA